jgi:hypothetical protein
MEAERVVCWFRTWQSLTHHVTFVRDSVAFANSHVIAMWSYTKRTEGAKLGHA